MVRTRRTSTKAGAPTRIFVAAQAAPGRSDVPTALVDTRRLSRVPTAAGPTRRRTPARGPTSRTAPNDRALARWRGCCGYALGAGEQPALMSGLFIRSKNVAPVEVPSASLIGRVDLADAGREGVDHPPGVWFSEDCHEITITASVWASGTPPSDTATTSGSGWTLALQFAHPRLGHESKYAPIITRQRKEPCP